MSKWILMPDSFKGTMSSLEICRLMREALLRHVPDAEVVSIPVADGGEGSVEAFLAAMGGHRVEVPCTGPDFRKISGFYGLLADGYTAVIEMAAAAGLPLMEGRLCAEGATTYGVGELILAAIRDGARRIILGLGGSATNDGGCGAAAALGVRFFDRQGRSFVPTGITLAEIADIDLSRRHPALDDVPLTVMCDIDNPLYGALGAAYVFAPQKGADAACVQRLDEGLRHFAAVLRQRLGIPVDKLPGGGAAGGFGAGCAALLGGTLRSGIETVLDTVDFDRRAAGYDLIVTGEGRLDSQSLGGKAVSGVAGRCHALGVPAAALVGALALEPDDLAALGLCSARSINPAGVTLQDTKAHAAAYYRDALVKLLEEMS